MAFFYAGGSPLKGYFKYLGEIASGGNINITSICTELGLDKTTLNADNIIAEPQYATNSASSSGTAYAGGFDEVQIDKYNSSSYTLSKTYNASTGVITASSLTTRGDRKSASRKGGGASCQANAYSRLKLYLFKEVQ